MDPTTPPRPRPHLLAHLGRLAGCPLRGTPGTSVTAVTLVALVALVTSMALVVPSLVGPALIRPAAAMPAPRPEQESAGTPPATPSLPATPGPARSAGSPVGPRDSGDRPRGEWPLSPVPPVVGHFDPPDQRWGAGHRGVDLRGRTGQQVRAAMAGRVSFSGRIAGVPIVVVDHGTTRTTYQPVRASVSRGQEVAAGQVVGRLEWFGSHCAPAACLHWGWRRGDTYLDPLLLVGAAPRPVRLLPW